MKNLLRVVVYGFLSLVMLALFLPLLGSGLRVIGILLFGWTGFLRRVIPNVTLNWSGIGTVLLCSVLIVGGTHWLCAWLHRSRQVATSAGANRWRWSWTISLYVALWLLFLTAMAATGLVHQSAWLIASKEPLLKERKHRAISSMELHTVADQLLSMATETGWDLDATRRRFYAENEQFPIRGKLPAEVFEVLFVPGSTNALAAVVIFHRDPAEQQQVGFIMVARTSRALDRTRPMNELSEALAKLGESTGSAHPNGTR